MRYIAMDEVAYFLLGGIEFVLRRELGSTATQ